MCNVPKQKFPLYLTDEERKLLRAAAGLSDLSMTAFITQAALTHARTVLAAQAAQTTQAAPSLF